MTKDVAEFWAGSLTILFVILLIAHQWLPALIDCGAIFVIANAYED